MPSLEETLALHTAALSANTLALNANTEAHGGKPAAGKPAVGKPAGTVAAKVPTFEQVKAAVVEVRDTHGKPAAQNIIRKAGGAAQLADVKAAKYPAVLAACKAIMEPADDDNSDDATTAADDDDQL